MSWRDTMLCADPVDITSAIWQAASIMKKINWPLIGPLAFLFIAGLAGFVAPAWAPLVARGVNEQWLGFIGNIIGAAGTLFAGWLAYQGVQKQIDALELTRKNAQSEAKLVAAVAIAQCVHAASLVVREGEKYLRSHPAIRRGQYDNFTEMMHTLDRSTKLFIVGAIEKDLGIDDRLQYLILVSRFAQALTVFEMARGSDPFRADEHVKRICGTLRANSELLHHFDQELGKTFDRDAASERED